MYEFLLYTYNPGEVVPFSVFRRTFCQDGCNVPQIISMNFKVAGEIAPRTRPTKGRRDKGNGPAAVEIYKRGKYCKYR